MKYIKLLSVLICSAVFLLGCGASGISQEDYNSIVKERDQYKDLYEQAEEQIELYENILGVSSGTVQNSDEDSDKENKLWEVSLTTDNVTDYIKFGVVAERDVFGDLTGSHYLISFSNIFEDGWYYYTCSDDFAIEYTLDDGNTHKTNQPFTIVTSWTGDNEKYTPDSVTVTRVQGQISFVNKKDVSQFDLKDGQRMIIGPDGTCYNTSGPGVYAEYPY